MLIHVQQLGGKQIMDATPISKVPILINVSLGLSSRVYRQFQLPPGGTPQSKSTIYSFNAEHSLLIYHDYLHKQAAKQTV